MGETQGLPGDFTAYLLHQDTTCITVRGADSLTGTSPSSGFVGSACSASACLSLPLTFPVYHPSMEVSYPPAFRFFLYHIALRKRDHPYRLAPLPAEDSPYADLLCLMLDYLPFWTPTCWRLPAAPLFWGYAMPTLPAPAGPAPFSGTCYNLPPGPRRLPLLPPQQEPHLLCLHHCRATSLPLSADSPTSPGTTTGTYTYRGRVLFAPACHLNATTTCFSPLLLPACLPASSRAYFTTCACFSGPAWDWGGYLRIHYDCRAAAAAISAPTRTWRTAGFLRTCCLPEIPYFSPLPACWDTPAAH